MPWVRSATLLCLAAAAISAQSLSAGADDRWSIAPVPPWVEEATLPSGDSPLANDASEGTLYLLVDHQVQVSGRSTAHYRRIAWKALSTAGVQNASEVKLPFDPDYQRLVIHHVRLLRDGQEVRALRARDVQVIHAERDLQARIYRGSLTALIFLEDLRVGDTVDYAYTVVGQNPILNGLFVDELALGFSVPVRLVRYRVLMPSARHLTAKVHGTSATPRTFDREGVTSYQWQASDVAAVATEDGAPGWYDPFPRLEVGEFPDWAAVARSMSALFEQQIRPAPGIERQIERLRQGGVGPGGRLVAATRFVQDEVRYLGIEMGSSSHRPHPPAQTLAQRFGDCKDKALLLVALLRGLGVDAAPALVNTVARRTLDDMLPSPFAFDHVIVQVRLGTRTVWIDATRSHQGGQPEAWPAPPFERALVLRAETKGLIPIPLVVPSEPETVVQEAYNVRPNGSARLTVRTAYRGREADATRPALAAEARADLERRFLDYYSRNDAGVQLVGHVVFNDDRDSNVLEVVETYELPAFWKDGERDLAGWKVGAELQRPAPTRRQSPLAIDYPVDVEHTISVEPAPAFDAESCTASVNGPLFTYDSQCRVNGAALVVTRRYRSLRDHVAPAEIGDYAATVARASETVESYVTLPTRLARRRSGTAGEHRAIAAVGLTLLGVIGLGVLWAGVGSARRWRRKRAFRRRARQDAGASPETALSAPTQEAMDQAAVARACACGAKSSLAIVERSQALYDHQRMEVLTLQCGACSQRRDVYARVMPPNGR